MNVLVEPYGKVGYSMALLDVGWICEHYGKTYLPLTIMTVVTNVTVVTVVTVVTEVTVVSTKLFFFFTE